MKAHDVSVEDLQETVVLQLDRRFYREFGDWGIIGIWREEQPGSGIRGAFSLRYCQCTRQLNC